MSTDPMTAIRLTRYSHGAGCACKLGPAELAQVLRYVPVATDPRILVDASSRDDAAVFQVAPDRAIVATVDFFTPIVDDPYDFGRIAATNAFSDVYAMGATPLLALNLVGWPREALPFELLGEVLRGGADVARAAGAFVLGGHSVDDPEPKYGMVAIGEVHPDRIVRNSGAKPGDVLVLTKPLGTGVLTTALKRDLLTEQDVAPAVTAMTTLNAGAARAMLGVGVHAATDVTGFGLLGHLRTLLEASGAAAEVRAAAVPLLPRARGGRARSDPRRHRAQRSERRRHGSVRGRRGPDGAPAPRGRPDLGRAADRRSGGAGGRARDGAAPRSDPSGRKDRSGGDRDARRDRRGVTEP